jgi:cytochrome c oxidase cbb3-type subunit 1
MTATSSTSPAPIDASCRLPLFALFGGAAVWLALSSVLGLIASIKFHSPGFLTGCAWMTYGRIHPAGLNLLVFGFAIPAGLGVALWLLSRLGQVTLARPGIVFIGAKLWHLGVFVGLLGILSGNTTGFEWLEMPRYAAIILFTAFLLMALLGFATYQSRHERALFPSQWFLLASLFWFPWIYSTANLLLLVFPVRGVVQASIDWWYSGNLLVVWLSLAGLAASFYLMPKLSDRPLQSHYLALFIFLTLILFGAWVGIPADATLPAWMPALSGAAATMTLVPTLAIATSAWLTLRGSTNKCPGGPLSFVKFGIWSLVLSGLMLAASSVPQVSRVTDFTWFGTAQTQLRLYGFFAMTMFGAVYYILPRIAASELPFAKLVRIHFWFGVFGALLLALPLALGGLMQGLKLVNPSVPFMDVTKSTLMFLRISTLGDMLLLFGNVFFLLNVTALVVRYYRAVCNAAYASATAPLETAEVGA